MTQRINVVQEVKVQIENIAASVNDFSLDVRGRNDDIAQIFQTSDDETASVLIKTDFINSRNRITPSSEFNKTEVGYTLSG
jgi:hypothetical protein